MFLDTDKQPGISFDGVILANEKFYRKPNIGTAIVTSLSITTEFNYNENEPIFNLVMNATLIGKDQDNEVYRLDCSHVGLFSIINNEKNMEPSDFIKHNAAALLFPYVREHITNITMKANVPTVYIQPLNIVALSKQE